MLSVGCFCLHFFLTRRLCFLKYGKFTNIYVLSTVLFPLFFTFLNIFYISCFLTTFFVSFGRVLSYDLKMITCCHSSYQFYFSYLICPKMFSFWLLPVLLLHSSFVFWTCTPPPNHLIGNTFILNSCSICSITFSLSGLTCLCCVTFYKSCENVLLLCLKTSQSPWGFVSTIRLRFQLVPPPNENTWALLALSLPGSAPSGSVITDLLTCGWVSLG